MKLELTPLFARAMHTPSNAWSRARLPSTTLTLTRTVSPGAKAGMGVSRPSVSFAICSRSRLSMMFMALASRLPASFGSALLVRGAGATGRGAAPGSFADSLRGASGGWPRGLPTTALAAPRGLPSAAGGYSAGIRASPASKLSSSSPAASPSTPGSSLTQASMTAIAAISPPAMTKSPTLASSRPRPAITRSSTPSKRPHSSTSSRSPAQRRTAARFHRAAARGEAKPRPTLRRLGLARRIERRRRNVGPYHHAGAATEGGAVDRAVLIAREGADVQRFEAPQAGVERLARRPCAERPGNRAG